MNTTCGFVNIIFQNNNEKAREMIIKFCLIIFLNEIWKLYSILINQIKLNVILKTKYFNIFYKKILFKTLN